MKKYKCIGMNGKLSEEEMALLLVMKEYLHSIKDELYSPQTERWDSDLTKEQFNSIMSRYSIVSASEIYWKAVEETDGADKY